jgi:RNA polymerase primary sigma factor
MPKKKNEPARDNSASIGEDRILFKELQQGSEEARDKLVAKYSVWVHNIAKKYHSCFPHIELGELVAEGNRGLLEAFQRFDITKETKFSTYAWFWIIKNIQEYITTSMMLIGVPSRMMADLKKIIGSMNDEIKKGNEPSLPDIARKLHIDASKAMELLTDRKNLSNPVSLDKYLDEDDKEQTLADIIDDNAEGYTLQRLLRAFTVSATPSSSPTRGA